MKVALFITDKQIPSIGGGYTFQSQLIDAVLRLNSESKHTFIFYKSGKRVLDPNLLYSSNLSYCSEKSDREWIKSQLLIAKKYVSHQLNPKSTCLYNIIVDLIDKWREVKILKSLRENQVDLTLSFVPNCPTVNYPYIVTVWDLQHRLQSYFPEVSAFSEWENRENIYSKILNRAAIIITGTEIGKAEIERFYQIPAERIKVIPLFTPQFILNSCEENEAVSSKYGIPDRYLFIRHSFGHTKITLVYY